MSKSAKIWFLCQEPTIWILQIFDCVIYFFYFVLFTRIADRGLILDFFQTFFEMMLNFYDLHFEKFLIRIY